MCEGGVHNSQLQMRITSNRIHGANTRRRNQNLCVVVKASSLKLVYEMLPASKGQKTKETLTGQNEKHFNNTLCNDTIIIFAGIGQYKLNNYTRKYFISGYYCITQSTASSKGIIVMEYLC